MNSYTNIFDTFNTIKPIIIQRFRTYLQNSRTSPRGRKRQLDLEIFFTAFYSNLRDATSPSNFKLYFGLPKSTYFHYLKLLRQSQIVDNLEREITNNYTLGPTLAADTFTVKSHNGHEGVGRNNTDRGRNGVKVQIISDIEGVIQHLDTSSANTHDSKIFTNTLTAHNETYSGREILMDAAYIGRPVRTTATNYGLIPIVVPKRKANGQPTHALTDLQKLKIKKRWYIERQIGVLRRFKAVSNKYAKTLATYKFFLAFSKLLVNYYYLKPDFP